MKLNLESNGVFTDHDPTKTELEIFRLCLSTFQDGSGQLKVKAGTLPGWRDYERTVGEITQGMCTEDKGIFDVLCNPPKSTVSVGLSCKMRKELARIKRDGRVTIELSNSSKEMWQALATDGITAVNYKANPGKVGNVLVSLVEEWHKAAATYQGQSIDVSKSRYLALLWDQKTGEYQLFKFLLELPDPSEIHWYFPESSGQSRLAGHLNGDDASGGRIFEWYGESGGQLKYYPHRKDALWESPVFTLESMPINVDFTLSGKAVAYFPSKWNQLEFAES